MYVYFKYPNDFHMNSILGFYYDLLLSFQGLLKEMVKFCDGEVKCEVTRLAAYHEHRLHLGSKAIYHIEAFVATFMALYKKFLEENMSGMF